MLMDGYDRFDEDEYNELPFPSKLDPDRNVYEVTSKYI